MKLAIVQLDMLWEDKEGNKAKIRQLLHDYNGDTDLMLFPEMTLSGFSTNRSITELNTKDCVFFRDLAKKHSCTVMYGGVENGFNICRTVNKSRSSFPDYRKTHLFTYAGEDNEYKSGTGCLGFELQKTRIKPTICYDLRFSYLYWSNAKSTDVFLNIASWPSVRELHWKTLLRARAIENQAFMIGVNRTGSDPNAAYSGASAVYSPLGEEILLCGAEEGVYTAEIDINEVAKVRKNYPFLKDRLR